jgi:uridine nucleosidase
MAILAAFNSPEVEVIGLTTIFGNVPTRLATRNAILLRELAGRRDVPVAEGALTSLRGVAKDRIADFVHGSDGFGNTNPPPAEVGAFRGGAPLLIGGRAGGCAGCRGPRRCCCGCYCCCWRWRWRCRRRRRRRC